MGLETRRRASAKMITMAGVKHFDTFGEKDVIVTNDTDNPPEVLITMESTRWAGQASRYVASNGYRAMV